MVLQKTENSGVSKLSKQSTRRGGLVLAPGVLFAQEPSMKQKAYIEGRQREGIAFRRGQLGKGRGQGLWKKKGF